MLFYLRFFIFCFEFSNLDNFVIALKHAIFWCFSALYVDGVNTLCFDKGGDNMRSDYIFREQFEHVLASLMPENRLALEISLSTGLRISDVLSLRSKTVFDAVNGRFTVREQKTSKNRRVYLPVELRKECLSIAGKLFVFEGRLDCEKHRTRQAVYKDLKRSAFLFRLDKRLQISPHSARKVYAVDKRLHGYSTSKLKSLLNHSDEAVTMVYAMADTLTSAKLGTK